MSGYGRVFNRAVAHGVLLSSALMASAVAAEAGMTDIKRLDSAYSFAETVQRLRGKLEEHGTPLMLAAPDFALELPLKVLVRQEAGGQVLIVYTPAAALEGRYGLPAGMAGKLAGAETLLAAAVQR
jgi:uncharacterized protein (DUF302 family)